MVSLGFSLCRVYPCTIENDTFIGIIVTALSILVTIAIAYQIFNVIEFKNSLNKQKEEMNRIAAENTEMQKNLQEQQKELQKRYANTEEKLYMSFALIYDQYRQTNIHSFILMHNALFYSIESEADDYDSIFDHLESWVENISWASFTINSFGKEKSKQDNKHDHQSSYKNIQEYIESRINPIRETEKKIKAHPRYAIIKYRYELLMNDFYDKIQFIIDKIMGDSNHQDKKQE